jgi:multimeric flavodoxin WrbA
MFTKPQVSNKMHQSNSQLTEGLEQGDLGRLVHNKLHIDEFKSKMGSDADIIVLSFKVDGKEPANDLMNFIERGYDWILDSDVSSGELEDGQYLVFAEIEREPSAGKHIYQLMSDVMNLTDNDLSDWKFQYRKNSREHDITPENLVDVIPMTPESYRSKFVDKDIEAMQESARVAVNRKAPVNPWTESLRVAAGLK